MYSVSKASFALSQLKNKKIAFHIVLTLQPCPGYTDTNKSKLQKKKEDKTIDQKLK